MTEVQGPLDTVGAGWAFVLFGDVFGSLQWVADVDSKGGVGEARRRVFDQVDSTRASQL